jgi:carbonic anhydrase
MKVLTLSTAEAKSTAAEKFARRAASITTRSSPGLDIPSDLLDGYRRFRAGAFADQADQYRALAEGQAPTTMVIGCADSRVDPATIFAAGPGELFVVRNVGAVVPPCEAAGTYHGTSAAIEFAVTGLGVANIVVLGHGLCGGVAAAFEAAEKKPVGRFIGPWVALLTDICTGLKAQAGTASAASLQQAAEHKVVQRSLANLVTFPFVAEAVDAGRLALHGAWFSIAEGALHWLDPATGTFAHIPE